MAKKRTRAEKKAQRSRARKFWGRLGMTTLVLFVVGGLLGIGGFVYLYSTTEVPDPNSDFTTNTTFLYYQDGANQLGSLAVQNRVTISYDDMPQLMKDAVIAAENRSFWEDPGFSVPGMLRGAWSIARGGEIQGGSTITQQYIKIFYLDSSRTLTRKVRELFLATKMGREVPKEQILEGYLNTIYFGRGAYGIQAAAKSYFLKDSKDLTVGEAAALAAILNNPAGFNPSGGEDKLEKLLGRYQYVLDGMLEMGAISEAEHSASRDQLPEFPTVPVNNRYGGPKGFLIKMVEDELLANGFSEGEIQGGGLKIVTTLNKPMQEAAIQEAQNYTAQAAADAEGSPDPSKLHVAISSVDTATGGVLALYGGPDYVKNSRNWATTKRPAASTFKPFATVAALRNGFSLQTVLKGNTFTPRGDTQPINNQNQRQYGRVTLRKATADSINTAFVDLTEQMDNGRDEVIKAANDAGAPTGPAWVESGNRVALGFGEVSPLDMANSYATLANSGQRNETHIVKEVLDREGNVIYEAKSANQQTIDENVAANVTDSLRAVVEEGTGRQAQELSRPAAGKTGTNGIDDTITSAWFVGYTKQISTAVMYVAGDGGNEDLRPYKQRSDRTFYGSSYPLMTWVSFMERASEGMPVEDFDEPEAIKADRGETTDTSQPPATEEEQSPTPTPSPSPTPTPSATPTPTPTATPTVVTPPPAPVTTEPPPPAPSPRPSTQAPKPTPTPTRPASTPPPPATTKAPAPEKPKPPPPPESAPPAPPSDDAQDEESAEG